MTRIEYFAYGQQCRASQVVLPRMNARKDSVTEWIPKTDDTLLIDEISFVKSSHPSGLPFTIWQSLCTFFTCRAAATHGSVAKSMQDRPSLPDPQAVLLFVLGSCIPPANPSGLK